jgi:integrase
LRSSPRAPRAIEQQLRFWLDTMPDKRPEALLFPAANGGPMRMGNYLRRVLRPAADRARELARAEGWDVPADFLAEVTHQIFRRTCATQMQQTGTVRDIQAHLRHSSPQVTLERYVREIPESVRAAVEALDARIMQRSRMSQ